MSDEIFTRQGNGPIIRPEDMPTRTIAVFNPGAARLNGETVLLLRTEDRQGISEIRVARSRNGISDWKIEERPLLQPDLPEYPYEEWGCEDARITKLQSDLWVIAYTAVSRYGPAVALASTSDFRTVNRLGVVLSPTNKDATIFPRQFNGKWIMLHRPVTGGDEHIWYVSGENDFIHWSRPGLLMPERPGPWWDGLRIGCGAQPIETEEGWLLIFHGVKEMGNRPIYRLGLALLDLEDPRRVLKRASHWVFAPETEYEQHGLVPDVVYTCGAVCHDDEVWMYYGAADTVIGLATARIPDMLAFVNEYDFLSRLKRSKGMLS